MIAEDFVRHLDRFRPHYRPMMLMLGAQQSSVPGFPEARDWFAQHVGLAGYEELDMVDGDLKLDLNDNLEVLSQQYQTVFDLGTIEHVWNTHQAYVNALRAVAVGGMFLSHSPVGGWQDSDGLFNHGLHMTSVDGLVDFLKKNGFAVRDRWVQKWRTRGALLWLRAEKLEHREWLEPIYRLRGRSRAGYTRG